MQATMTPCATLERLLNKCQVYSFDPIQHHLLCLAHIVNLAIVDVMSIITKITNVETMSTIWEFDPTLPGNCVLGDSLNVITAVRTLAIKVCSITAVLLHAYSLTNPGP